MLTAINALLSLVPRWVWVALVAALSATSCKLKWDNNGLSLEIEKHETRIAELQLGIEASHAAAATQGVLFAQQTRAAEQARDKRIQTLVADKSRLADELAGLQLAVSQANGTYSLRAKPDTLGTGLDTTDPFPELFLSCSQRYSEVAKAADDHANDAKTLTEAWPTVEKLKKVDAP